MTAGAFAYQIVMSGCGHEPLAMNATELGDQYIALLGTVPHLHIIKIHSGEHLSLLEISNLTGIPASLITRLHNARCAQHEVLTDIVVERKAV